jgi:hypothetical protein
MNYALLIAAALLASVGTAQASPKPDKCSGELSQLQGKWVIKVGREGICTFSGDDVKTKVLAVCSEGRGCEVIGVIDDCKDSGECSEIKSVRSVRPIQLRRQRR